ncbi:unnamed protein product [Heterobilharzia americana]|nr:unnamed protein product [Heterobilharzia americana]
MYNKSYTYSKLTNFICRKIDWLRSTLRKLPLTSLNCFSACKAGFNVSGRCSTSSFTRRTASYEESVKEDTENTGVETHTDIIPVQSRYEGIVSMHVQILV